MNMNMLKSLNGLQCYFRVFVCLIDNKTFKVCHTAVVHLRFGVTLLSSTLRAHRAYIQHTCRPEKREGENGVKSRE